MAYLVLIGGPNGSGKSTLVSSGVLSRIVGVPEDPPPLIINPDALARTLGPVEDPKVQLEAAERADALLFEAIAEGRSVMRETVLSTDRLLPAVQMAVAKGFIFIFLFVVLRDPELNVERVHARNALGGHGVPEQKIRDRWSRSLAMAPRFMPYARAVLVFDNSTVASLTAGPVILAERTPDGVFVSDEGAALLADPATPDPIYALLCAVYEPEMA